VRLFPTAGDKRFPIRLASILGLPSRLRRRRFHERPASQLARACVCSVPWVHDPGHLHRPVGGSLILYGASLGFGFIGYDENTVLLGHPNLYNQSSLLDGVHEILVGYFPREEPLLVRDLSWLLDARLFGFTNPVGYH